MVDDLIYGKLLDSLYPKSFLMTDEDGLQHEVIHYGDVKNAIEDFRIELKKRVGVSKMENGDTISRQAAIDTLNEQIEQCNKALGSFDISLKDEFAIKVERASLKAYKEQLENLPSAQPKRGEWICTDDFYETAECSCCKWDSGEAWDYATANFKFCPNCGAVMNCSGIPNS